MRIKNKGLVAFLRQHKLLKLDGPIIIVGPSGVGKGEIVKGLMRMFQDILILMVSCTTRRLREGEVDGQHYYSISSALFEMLYGCGAFLSRLDKFQSSYADLKAPVYRALKQGKRPVLEVCADIVSELLRNKKFRKAQVIVITPPNPKELERRIRSRADSTITEEQILARLASAEEEIAKMKQIAREFPGSISFVVNDNLDRALEEVAGIIFPR